MQVLITDNKLYLHINITKVLNNKARILKQIFYVNENVTLFYLRER